MVEVVRRLPEYLRANFNRLNNQPIWFDRLWLVVVLALVAMFSFYIGQDHAERQYQKGAREIQQVNLHALGLAAKCVDMMDGVTRAAIIIANDRTRTVASHIRQ